MGIEGKIALIERGEITFSSKVARVHDAGAVAAIIYNNEQGNFRGTLRGRSQIPAISLSRADGLDAHGLNGDQAMSLWRQPLPSRTTPFHRAI